MSSKVEPIPTAVTVEQELVAPACRRLRCRAFASAVFGASALFFVSACTSKNPDALPGTNVDENLAIMDANAAENASGPTLNSSDSNAVSMNDSSNRQDRSGGERPATKAPRSPTIQSGEINSVETGADGPPDRDETGGNQVGNDEGIQNDVQ
jgi:hypothetical protein